MSGRPAPPDTERSVAPEPEFAVLGARTVRHAAVRGPTATATSTSCARWPREPAARSLRRPVAPEPEFQVLGATGRRHAAVPAIDFDVHVSEPGGRHGVRDRAQAR